MKLVRENIEFKRGIEPSDAMQTSEAWRKKVILQFLRNIVDDEQFDEGNENFSGFLNVGYSTLSKENKIGFKEFVNTWPEYEKQMKFLGLRVENTPNLDETVFTLDWVDDILNHDLKEQLNFKRGIEPKSAMDSGMSSMYKQWDLFQLLYQESCESDYFHNVTDIEYDKRNDQYMFIILSRFCDENHEEIEYTVYLNKEFVVLYDEEDRPKKINSLEEFDRITKVYGLRESYNFQRGIEPKEAMNTADKFEILHEHILKEMQILANRYELFLNDHTNETQVYVSVKFRYKNINNFITYYKDTDINKGEITIHQSYGGVTKYESFTDVEKAIKLMEQWIKNEINKYENK